VSARSSRDTAVAPLFFESPLDFRRWLQKNHAAATELLVGFYRTDSGRPSMTWPESVDEALSFGWIDGVRKRIDEVSYSIRFTPRRKESNWSAINIARVKELIAQGRMHPAGIAAWEKRRDEKSAIYAYENRPRQLPPEAEREFKSHRKAWRWFSSQAPSYQRVAIYWVTSAKKEETRQRRLRALIGDSEKGQRLAQYTLEPRGRK
jgi:uncharacterized protein YdeI (YjbR/CyaY-like superfamily)